MLPLLSLELCHPSRKKSISIAKNGAVVLNSYKSSRTSEKIDMLLAFDIFSYFERRLGALEIFVFVIIFNAYQIPFARAPKWVDQMDHGQVLIAR